MNKLLVVTAALTFATPALADIPVIDNTNLAIAKKNAENTGEIMKTNTAIQNMIREDKLHQLDSILQSSAAEGMCTMDSSLLRLYREGKITKETALLYCVYYENMQKRLSL